MEVGKHGIKVPKVILVRLTDLARKTGLSVNQHVRKALLSYLNEEENLLIANQRLKKGSLRIRFEDLERELLAARDN